MRFLEKNKKTNMKKSAKSKKKIYEKSWTATASVSNRPKEKARAFVIRAFVFLGSLTFLEHAARTAAYYNRIRTRPACRHSWHAEDR
jgi:hypothetical protein